MYARALQEAEAELVEVRHDELHRLGLSGLALGASFTATAVCPPLVLPLFLGGLTIGALGIRSLWRRWDLVDRLADDGDAHVIPEVRAYAARDARMDRRLGHAAQIRTWIEQPSLPDDVRIVADELEELACALEDRDLELDPASAIACRRLVGDPMASPLLNSALPRDDIRSSIARIRSGFRPRTQT